MNSRKAFTLIELLVVIAIIAILSVVVILTLNPAELLRQSRDANRISDLATINTALNLYNTDQGVAASYSLGAASTTYMSIADPSATSTAGDQCQGLGLASIGSSSTWNCSPTSTFRTVGGTGWIPVNFSNITSGAPFGTLPVDPINTTSSGNYYSYVPGSMGASTYELVARLESQKYTQANSVGGSDGGYSNQYDEVGKDLTLAPSKLLDRVSSTDYFAFDTNGLAGFWPLNEGTGNTVYDQSGNGNNGTTTLIGWSTSCQVGTSCITAVQSDGTINVPSSTSLSLNKNFSMSAWVKLNAATAASNWPFVLGDNSHFGYAIRFQNNGTSIYFEYATDYPTCGGSTYNATGVINIGTSTWHYYGVTYDGSLIRTYLDGLLAQTSTGPAAGMMCLNFPISIAGNPASPGSFSESDARIYSRVLSTTEVQAIYNAGR